MGRLKPGVTPAQVQGNLAGVFQHTARDGFDSYLASLPPEARSRPDLQDRTQVPELLVDSGSRGIYDVDPTDLRAVTVLTAVVALVLLIVCANVANLLLSRATGGRKNCPCGWRSAPRARGWSVSSSRKACCSPAIGGALGILVGRWGQQLLPGATGQVSPLDWRVLAFVLAVTTVTGIVFGIAPALRATRTDVNAALKENSRSVAGSRSLLGRPLVVAQVAISLVLAHRRRIVPPHAAEPSTGGRRIQSAERGAVPGQPGAEPVRQAEGKPPLRPDRRAPSRDCRRPFGGVVAPAADVGPTVIGRASSSRAAPMRRGSATPSSTLIVSPTFFETMEIPLVAGRGFTARDTSDAPRVAVINEAAARKYFPNEIADRPPHRTDPRGQRQAGNRRHPPGREIQQRPRRRRADACTRRILQNPQGSATFEVRTAGDPLAAIAGIRDAVRQVDPTLPLIERDDAAGRSRTPLPAGEGVCAGVHAVRRARAARGIGRPVRRDVVQRRAPHQRDRHPHGARRAAAGRACGW